MPTNLVIAAAAWLIQKANDNKTKGSIKVVDIINTRREEVGIGETIQRYDNRGNPRPLPTQEFEAIRKWRHQHVVQVERTRTAGSNTSVSFTKGIATKIEQTLQETMRNSLSVTDSIEETFRRTVPVDVGPNMLHLITLSWKEIWQLGYVKMLFDGAPVEVPFRTLVGLDFDQSIKSVRSLCRHVPGSGVSHITVNGRYWREREPVEDWTGEAGRGQGEGSWAPERALSNACSNPSWLSQDQPRGGRGTPDDSERRNSRG